MFSKIAIIGTGLLGASIGLAVRRRVPKCRIVGIGRRLETLEIAQRIGAVDTVSLSIAAGVKGCELVIVCTPVGRIADQVLETAHAADNSPIITDVGSTKQAICEMLESQLPLPNGCRFLGSHPFAGSEKTGPEAASETLFDDRVVVLTPTVSTDAETLDTLQNFWQMLGANVVCMSPDEHDRTLALTSHLPHALSVILATVCDRQTYGEFCGTGYESMTRLAEGSPEIWIDILMSNRTALCQTIDIFVKSCDQLRAALEKNDAEAVLRFLKKVQQ